MLLIVDDAALVLLYMLVHAVSAVYVLCISGYSPAEDYERAQTYTIKITTFTRL
jgi:hypothetical protein